jgi:hypothetical protein
MKKYFILHLKWGGVNRHKQVDSMLRQGYVIVHHWKPQIIGESHVYVFVKE